MIPAGARNPIEEYLSAVHPERRALIVELLRKAVVALGGHSVLDLGLWVSLCTAPASEIEEKLRGSMSSEELRTCMQAVRAILRLVRLLYAQSVSAWHPGSHAPAAALDPTTPAASPSRSLATAEDRGSSDGTRERGPSILSNAGLDTVLRVCARRPKRRAAREAAIAVLAIGYSLRCSELAALDLDDYDRRQGVLSLREGDARETVSLSPSASEVLSRWLAERGSTAGPLFSISRGRGKSKPQRYSARELLNLLRELVSEAVGSSSLR